MNTEETEDLKVPMNPGLDRGDKTIEELEATMPAAGLALVDQMEVQSIEAYEKDLKRIKRAKRHFNRRNRTAWDRMNRPHRLEKLESNMERVLNFMSFKGYVYDKDLPPEPEVTPEAAVSQG
jgi:hypothetical protein